MSMGNSDMAAPLPLAAAPVPRRRLTFAQVRPFLAPVLITLILAVGEYNFQILESYWATGSAIVTAIGLEIILRRFVSGRWPHIASAYITGISVGILVRSPHDLWPFVLCSMLSITSKYVLRVKGRHLWNPSNLGVSVLLFLAPERVAALSLQFGNNIWPSIVILCLGSLVLLSLGRLHITLTYAAAFTALSWLRSGWTENLWITELALLTAPSYQLFMFFMVTDPATTTRTRGRQCLVAVLVAVVETILRLMREIHATYYALFIVAPITNLIEIWWENSKKHASPQHERQA